MATHPTATPRMINGLAELRELAGEEIGVSEWVRVDQGMIDDFAAVTGDHQWIHVNVERAREESPFKTTIAHGYLILSLAAQFGFEVFSVDRVRFGLNYGLERVRFTAPVPSGSRVRARVSVGEVRDTAKGTLAEFSFQFESDAADKPVCIAKTLSLFVE